MPTATERFDRLVARLETLCRAREGVELRVLPEWQLVIRKGMSATPRDPVTKAAREAPSSDGYEIFVSSRAAGSADAAPSALLRPRPSAVPDPDELTIMDEPRERTWSLVGPSGESLSVRVRAGADAPLHEVSSILDEVRESLLAGGGR